jgi:hypothetical protein
MSDENSPFVTGRTALITTLIAIALNPLSLVAGYFISQLLQAPNLAVTALQMEYEIEPLKLDPETQATIDADPNFDNAVIQDLRMAGKVNCDAWHVAGTVKAACAENVLDIVHNMVRVHRFELGNIEENINRITNYTPSTILVAVPFPIDTARMFDELRHGNKASLTDFLGAQAEWKRRISVLNAAETALQKARQTEKRRSGQVTIRVGVLNSGDSDAVIEPDGELTFDDRKVALRRAKMRTDVSGRPLSEDFVTDRVFTPVKARNFSEVAYTVNNAGSTKADIDQFEEAVRTKRASQFTVVIRTSSGQRKVTGRFTD